MNTQDVVEFMQANELKSMRWVVASLLATGATKQQISIAYHVYIEKQ